MKNITISDKDLNLIKDCIKAVKAINFDDDKYDQLLSKLKEGTILPIQNVRQSDLSKSKNPWRKEYKSKVEFCNNCKTQNLHTHIDTGKKCCACCGAC